MLLRIIASTFLIAISGIAKAELWIDRGCSPDMKDCSNSIQAFYIYGEINRATSSFLEQIDHAYPKDKPFPKIYINSDGGSVHAALEIGRILRSRKASIETDDRFFPENKARCYSACVIVALGAVERNINHIGVHQGFRAKRLKGGKYDISPLPSETIEKINAYYSEMKVSKDFLELEAQSKSYKDMIELDRKSVCRERVFPPV